MLEAENLQKISINFPQEYGRLYHPKRTNFLEEVEENAEKIRLIQENRKLSEINQNYKKY